MAIEKTPSYLSSIKEVSPETKSLSSAIEAKRIKLETDRAVKLALKKDFDGALSAFLSLENEEMALIIQKCIELQPIFEEFLNGHITYAQYKKAAKKFPEESQEIVQYKFPDLEFIELRNLEKRFREKIEGIIDDLLSKNTLEDLIEARKVFEKHIGVVKKPYNFDRLFLKTISVFPYSKFDPLYKIEWPDVDKLLNGYLLKEAKSFAKAEKIINEIKVISANRDTVQLIIRKFNKEFDSRLRQNYREPKLKQFVKEYKAHHFYVLGKNNKITTKIDPFFLQRRIYAIYYVNENPELFLEMLRANFDCINAIPLGNQRTYYHAIIRSVRIVRDYSLFELFSEEILQSESFIDVINDTLEEDEETIRGIVQLLKGKENQKYMESLFLKVYKKELSFADTKNAPSFNKENAEIYIEKYKENEHAIHRAKVGRVFVKIIAAIELIISAAISIAVPSVCAFAFKRQQYFLGVLLLLAGVALGIWMFVRMEEIVSLKRKQRLFDAKRTLDNLESENVLILKKIYLGLD